MLIEASQCDEVQEIRSVILRDKEIEYFDDNKQDRFKMEEMVNIEAVYASHNLIRDLYGIAQLTTLRELNLSFN